MSLGARRSVASTESDVRLFAILREAAGRHARNEPALAEYIGEAYRCRWTYSLIGEAMQIPPARVSRIRHRDLARRGLI